MKVLVLLCIVGFAMAASPYKDHSKFKHKDDNENVLQEEGSGEYEEDEIPPGMWSEKDRKIFLDVARALDKVRDDLTEQEQDFLDARLEGDDCNERDEHDLKEEDDELVGREKRQAGPCGTCEKLCSKRRKTSHCKISCCYPKSCHTKCTWWGHRAKCDCY